MHYEGHVIRPPSEAESILLQVTVGCSHNRCAFCGTYRGVRHRIKDDAVIAGDLAEAARDCRDVRRLFLCDGDVLSLPQAYLVALLKRVRATLPWVDRIGTYATAVGMVDKSEADLRELRDHGLRIAYLGLESGDDTVLAAMAKGTDAEGIVDAGRRLKSAGIKCSVTVILGLAGEQGWQRHAARTGAALTAMDPDQVGVLTLMLVPGSPLHASARAGRFQVPGPEAMLRELRELLACTTLSRGLFLANHASNFLPLTLRLPSHKAEALRLIDEALAGRMPLTPEYWRAL
jgi:radical SAM superfamily enzyme YgiQ (UPF0313 family)